QSRARLGGPEGRLRVLPDRGSGRGIPRVADGDVPFQCVERGLIEHLRDEAEILVDQHRGAVTDCNAGRLLAAMLKRIEGEVGELRDCLAGCPYAEDSAGVLRAFFAGIELVGQPSVRTRHKSESTGRPPAGTPPRGTLGQAVVSSSAEAGPRD